MTDLHSRNGLVALAQRAPINFLVVGAQKSGTTALDHFLRQHSSVEMAATKEAHFFDDEIVFSKREQMLILKFEDLRQKPCQTLNSVARFLDIPDFPPIRPQDVHSRPYVSSMSVAERDYLRSIFYYEIKQLERMLGWNCEGWLK